MYSFHTFRMLIMIMVPVTDAVCDIIEIHVLKMAEFDPP